MRTTAIIVAAGQGRRFGGDLPKQFQIIGGKPVVYHTLQKFEAATSIDEIVVITSVDWMSFVAQEVVEEHRMSKVTRVIEGGKERQDSVYRGLQTLKGSTDFVVVHDAVRPLVAVSKIDEAVFACRSHDAVILAVPPKDTIKQAENGYVTNTIDRAGLWAVQTPQVFRYELLLQAYESANKAGVYMTDDAGLVELLGHSVRIVPGNYENIKITVPADMRVAEIYLEENLS